MIFNRIKNNSFFNEIHDSEQIAGIPEDKTLLDPDKIAEATI